MFKNTHQPWLRFIENDNDGGGSGSAQSQDDAGADSTDSTDREGETPGNKDADDSDADDDSDDASEAWKQRSRKWENRAKENKKALDELQVQMNAATEKVKQSENQLADAIKGRADAEACASRLRIAIEFELSVEEAETFLTGDEPNMRKQAELLTKRAGSSPKKPHRVPTSPLQGRGESGVSKKAAEDWAMSLMGKKPKDNS